ncbi:DUF333 domain-containing protein [Candidatus Woesearchaeota archaeon]|nr:DUF333 domain-containing protein [Candidatus Woesearchaeota archaeon]
MDEKIKVVRAHIIVLLVIIFTMSAVQAMKNPAAVYCESMGYQYVTENQFGQCKITETEKYDAFEFYTGEKGVEYNYCAVNGYEYVVENETIFCLSGDDGNEKISVDKMMKLDFNDLKVIEEICGDGICIRDENHGNCPQDCKQSMRDYYCEPIDDGLCDQDCIILENQGIDKDCPVQKPGVPPDLGRKEPPKGMDPKVNNTKEDSKPPIKDPTDKPPNLGPKVVQPGQKEPSGQSVKPFIAGIIGVIIIIFALMIIYRMQKKN